MRLLITKDNCKTKPVSYCDKDLDYENCDTSKGKNVSICPNHSRFIILPTPLTVGPEEDKKLIKDLIFKNMGIPEKLITDQKYKIVKSRFDSTLDLYPTINNSYIRYNSDSTILPPSFLIDWHDLMHVAEIFNDVDIPVFICQSRYARNDAGHILDPWNRSMHEYSPHFKCDPIYRRTPEFPPKTCEELVAWVVQTTLNGMIVGIVLWEKIEIKYPRYIDETKILDPYNPMLVLKNPSYSV